MEGVSMISAPDSQSKSALSAFIRAMDRRGDAAIVRYVYKDGSYVLA
jgi:hypothetical protein